MNRNHGWRFEQGPSSEKVLLPEDAYLCRPLLPQWVLGEIASRWRLAAELLVAPFSRARSRTGRAVPQR